MASDAMSYFVGNDAVTGGYPEDGGFAINGGKGWSRVVFDYVFSNSWLERKKKKNGFSSNSGKEFSENSTISVTKSQEI